MPFVRFLYGWHGECWLEWGVEGIGCAVVLGAGGIWPPAFLIPLPRGIEASPFPTLRYRGGIWPPPFPTLLAGGALATTGKNSQSAIWRPVFFCTHPFAYKSKLLTLGLSTKKALKQRLRAFFRCCGERGIRTPGTVTRTSV